VAPFPIEASTDVTSDEADPFKFMKTPHSGVFGNVDEVSGLTDRHRYLAVVEAIVTLRQSDIEAPLSRSKCFPSRRLQHPMLKLHKATVSLASAFTIMPGTTYCSLHSRHVIRHLNLPTLFFSENHESDCALVYEANEGRFLTINDQDYSTPTGAWLFGGDLGKNGGTAGEMSK